MRLHEVLFAGLCLAGSVLAQTEEPPPTETEEPDPPPPVFTGVDTFANATVYQPDDPSTQVTYARTENVENNTILAAWNDPAQVNNTISVFKSTNYGFSWYPWGSAESSEAGRKLLQPHLLYLNGTFGEESNVTLLVVNAVDDRSTNIELYASWDQGESWEFQSHIAQGGPLNSTNGATPVRNPFMLRHGDDSVTVYYTDSRDQQHASKIVQQTTSYEFDGFSSAIDVVASSFYEDRPAMPSAAKLPNGYYIVAFEYALLNAETKTYTYPIYYKITNSPENMALDPTREIKVDTGYKPTTAPYVTWMSLGGVNGTIVLSDSTSNSVFINQALGEGTWKEVKTTAGRAYSREVRAVNNDVNKLRFAGGAEYGQTSPSQILITIMDFEKALSAPK